MSELLLGCGSRRDKLIAVNGHKGWADPTTLDIDPACQPDVLHDLNIRPLPFNDNSFDEIHAYEVLEHVGQQGDWRGFFEEFTEYWRILKPGGSLIGTSPNVTSSWAWGDPGHTRIISHGCFTFLSQAEYRKQVGKTPMTDYRDVWKGDFTVEHAEVRGEAFLFVLRALKPAIAKQEAA